MFQITNPARGRKQVVEPRRKLRHRLGFKSQTPQGDGNLPVKHVVGIGDEMFQITNPARGRKHGEKYVAVEVELEFQITNPARGRKLSVLFFHFFELGEEFQITNPARGRKLDRAVEPILDRSFQITNPARGRRRGCCMSQIRLMHSPSFLS